LAEEARIQADKEKEASELAEANRMKEEQL
jgi:hypothetical protein